MTTARTRVLSPAMLGLAMLLSACGSTVQTTSQIAAGAGQAPSGSTNAGPGPAAPGSTGLAPVSISGSTSGQLATTGGSAHVGSAGAGSVAGAGGSGGPVGGTGSGYSGAGTSVVNGPGITAKTISIGILYATNGAAYEAALGNTSVTSGDVGAEYHYLVKDLNDHGGIAGRKVVPVYHSIDATSGQSTAQSEQAVCADFTQDHKVFAMVPGGTQNILACMQKAGAVVAESGGLTGQTTAEYNQFPADFDATSISLDRLVSNLVPTLQRAKYFTPWDTTAGAPGASGKAVTGIVVPDQPEYHHAVDLLVRGLSRIGVAVASKDIIFYHWPQSSAEDGQTITEIQSSVLKFKTDGVTHVIPLEVNGQVFFASQADKQQYRPRYGINSASGDQAFNGSLIPSSQLHGAVGLGYFPGVDLPASMNPDNGPYSGPARRYCLAVMKKNGVSFKDTNAEAVALSLCDGLYQLKAVIEHADPSAGLNQRSIAASIDSVGTLPSATYITVAYGPGRRDAVSSGYQYQYFADCDCMHYTGPRFRLS